MANFQYGLIQLWRDGSPNLTNTIVSNASHIQGIFVRTSGDIYLDNSEGHSRVEVWTLNASTYVSTLYVGSECSDMFIDRNDSLYCSSWSYHRVIKRSLNSNDSQIATVVGSDCPGVASNMLNNPYGIFVDTNFDLYVADYRNDRVQLFPTGQSNGITVAGSGAQQTIDLYSPMDVVLDADSYVFIVDSQNNRIVGSGPQGFRCIVGCTRTGGGAPHQLSGPRSMTFDVDGNIFTTEYNNHRIQKFFLTTNSCSKLTQTTDMDNLISIHSRCHRSSENLL